MELNHLGVTIEADIIKQKLPENNGGYVALNSGGVSYGKSMIGFILSWRAIIQSIFAGTKWPIVIWDALV